MINQQTINSRRVDDRARASISRTPTWWLVFTWELRELWVGGKVLFLMILFAIMMSITSIGQEAESQLSMIPPEEIVFITLQSTISFALFIGLIVGADSISGERERATLESLLLTPTSRRQVVLGKFLAALSPWPVAMILAIPYLTVLAQGNAVLGPALILGAFTGSLLAIGFTSLGMLISALSGSNRISLLASLLVYVLLLIPTLWPGAAQKGDLGYAIQQLNPMQGTSEFLEKVLVNNRTVQEKFSYIVASILMATIIPTLLFLYAAPRLRLEGRMPRLSLPRLGMPRRSATTLLLLAFCILALNPVLPVFAGAPPPDQTFQISLDKDHWLVQTGTKIDFKTVVTNNGSQSSRPFHVSMNIIKIGSGDPVDPEDWSPERSQAVDSLGSGQTSELSWTVNAIMEGNYMVFLTVVPTPVSQDTTTQTTSSMGVHLVVKGSSNNNPGGVLPVALTIPSALILGTVMLQLRLRRRDKMDSAG